MAAAKTPPTIVDRWEGGGLRGVRGVADMDMIEEKVYDAPSAEGGEEKKKRIRGRYLI